MSSENNQLAQGNFLADQGQALARLVSQLQDVAPQFARDNAFIRELTTQATNNNIRTDALALQIETVSRVVSDMHERSTSLSDLIQELIGQNVALREGITSSQENVTGLHSYVKALSQQENSNFENLRAEISQAFAHVNVANLATPDSSFVGAPSSDPINPPSPPPANIPSTSISCDPDRLPFTAVLEPEAETAHSISVRLRIGNCPRYAGLRTNDAALNWTLSFRLWIRQYTELTRTRPTEAQAVAMVTDALDERAGAWWALLQRRTLATGSTVILPRTLDELAEAVCREFGELNAEDKRRARYEECRQTGTVQSYISAFQERLMYLDPQPRPYDILRQFKLHLDATIKKEMSIRHPDVLDPYVYWERADTLDRALREAERNSRSTSSPSSSRPRRERDSGEKPAARSFVISGGSRPSSSRFPDKRKDPAAFKKWCIENRACFECGNPKHSARSCPQKSEN